MNERLENERLSSFFDGEVAPEERAAIETELASSPEAQKQLEEIRVISGVLKALPKKEAPAELRAAVLQAAERATLLPDQQEPSGTRTRKSRWKSVLVTLATTSVAVLAIVFLTDRFGGVTFQNASPVASSVSKKSANTTSELVDTLNRTPLSSDEAAEVAFTPGEETAGLRQDAIVSARKGANRDAPAAESEIDGVLRKTVAMRGTRVETKEADAVHAKERLFSFDNGAVLEQLLRENKPAEPSAVLNQIDVLTVEIDELKLTLDEKKLNEAEVGQIVDALETSRHGEIAVVQLTVIDRQAGLESLQLLLAKHRVTQDARVSGGQIAGKSGSKLRNEVESDELIGVYVEATEEQLAATFRELNEAGPFNGLVLDRALQFAQREGASPSSGIRVSTEEQAKTNQKAEGSTSLAKKPANATPSPSAKDKNKAALNADDKQSPNGLEKSKRLAASDEALAMKAQQSQIPRQQQVFVAKRYLTNARQSRVGEPDPESPAKNAPAPTAPVASAKKDLERKRVADSKPAEDASKASRRSAAQPLQVLFVIVNADSGTAKPADEKAKAAKKKPNDGAA